jgi:hypothetical protein
MANDINKLRRIMRQANLLTNQSPANGNRSYALRVSHKIEDIRTDLRNGYVHFTYVKADGSYRVALGTLSPLLIPADKQPKPEKTESDIAMQENRDRLGLISYYDLNKDGWRSFYFYSLVEIEDENYYKAVLLNR